MTTNSNGGPGKTRHLNDIAMCCESLGMRVICIDAAGSDFWLSASLPCATTLEGKARTSQGVLLRERGHCLFLGKPGSAMSVTKQQMSRIFLAKSAVGQIKALYSGEDGERVKEAISQSCNIWYPLKSGDEHHDK